MCLILSKPSGVNLPKPEYLENAALSNRDGIGVAYHKKDSNEVVIKKDFKDDIELIIWLEKNITIDDSIIIHFRQATSGLKDEGNRHPYPLTKNNDLLRQTNLICKEAVAHNGVLREYSNSATFSDTQKFIMDILSDDEIKNNLKNPAIQKLIENFVGSDKLAFIFSDGSLLWLGTSYDEDGIQYSSASYKWSYYRQLPRIYQWKDPILYCGNCFKHEEVDSVKEFYFKKIKLILCRDCRRLLHEGTLTEYFEKEKDKKWLVPSNEKMVKCLECFSFVQKEDAFPQAFNTYICKNCQKIREYRNSRMMCQGCNTFFNKIVLTEYQGVLLCYECITELKKDDKDKPKDAK